jgi:hypothetical protein
MSACFRLRHGDGRFAPAAFLRLSACAPLSRSPNRRPKPCKTYWATLFKPMAIEGLKTWPGFVMLVCIKSPARIL